MVKVISLKSNIDLGWNSSTFIEITMNITEYSHVVLLQVEKIVQGDISEAEIVPVDQFPHSHQEEVESEHEAEYQLEDGPQEVGGEECWVVFKGLPDLHSVDLVWHLVLAVLWGGARHLQTILRSEFYIE